MDQNYRSKVRGIYIFTYINIYEKNKNVTNSEKEQQDAHNGRIQYASLQIEKFSNVRWYIIWQEKMTTELSLKESYLRI